MIGSPDGSKDAPIPGLSSNRYFRIAQYLRLIDSPLLIWLNLSNHAAKK